MKWRKLGKIYEPETLHPLLFSHAANPLPVHLDGDNYRVFFSGRDQENRSSVGYADVDISKKIVVEVSTEPVFAYGPPDSFFSHGVSIGNCYEADGIRYILFMGWQCPGGQHWRGDIGRLVLKTDLSLILDSPSPFLSTDSVDPVSLSYPWVFQEQDVFHMWYGSTETWDAGNDEMLHIIKYARSQNGHVWEKSGLALPYELGTAQAFSHPTLIGSRKEGYHMWFSYRSGSGQKYRIGYAKSADLKMWNLYLHDAGIDVSSSGWDSDMIEYPFVFDHKGDRYMLYNGNGYGKTGFGLAVLEED